MAFPPISPSKPISSPKNENQKKKKRGNENEKNRVKSHTKNPESAQQPPPPDPCSSPAKRTKCLGVRDLKGRIYDSGNVNNCHQCRQKTTNFVAACKNQRVNNPCTIKFCKKCLMNRYGEKAEEVTLLGDWKCPKCRGICNCSCCMKRKGHQPTGILVHTAKQTGFSSVWELLHVKGPENVCASTKKPTAASKELVVDSPRKLGKENSFVGKSDSNLPPKPLTPDSDGKKIGKSKTKKLGQNNSNGYVFEGSKDDGAQSVKKRYKQSLIFKEISSNPTKKEEKINEMDDDDDGAQMESSEKSQISKEIIMNPIKKEEKKIVERDDGNLLEKKKSEMWISEEISPEHIKKEEKMDKRDSSMLACNETKVPDSSNTVNAGDKRRLITDFHKLKNNAVGINNTEFNADIPLPRGIDLTTVAGIDLPVEDVGHALQFLEFCKAFGQVLNLRKGQPESVLRELTRGRNRHRGQYSSIVQLHILLLSLIQKDTGKTSPLSPTSSGNSWLQALGICISKSHCELKELPSDCFHRNGNGYDKLDASKKLRILNYLCDETLGTADLRSWIEKQNSKLIEREKEVKEKVLAAKDKERCVKQKMQDEVAKASLLKNGAPLSISEHDDIVSKIKVEAAKAHAETLEAMNMVPKKKQTSDAVRTEPVLLDGNGHAFWRLRSYSDEPNILIQDIGSYDSVTLEEKWFAYGVEQKKEVEKYISSVRKGLGSLFLDLLFAWTLMWLALQYFSWMQKDRFRTQVVPVTIVSAEK